MLSNKKRLELISFITEEEAYNYPQDDKIQKPLGIIYKISHPHKECRHEKWEKEAEEMYKKYIN